MSFSTSQLRLVSRRNPVRDLLIQSRELIVSPEHWTTGAFMRLADSSPVNHTDQIPEACQFCAMGAVVQTAGSWYDLTANGVHHGLTVEHNSVMTNALNMLNKAAGELIGISSIVVLNDGDSTWEAGGHELVLKAYDRAIELSAEYDEQELSTSVVN